MNSIGQTLSIQTLKEIGGDNSTRIYDDNYYKCYFKCESNEKVNALIKHIANAMIPSIKRHLIVANVIPILTSKSKTISNSFDRLKVALLDHELGSANSLEQIESLLKLLLDSATQEPDLCQEVFYRKKGKAKYEFNRRDNILRQALAIIRHIPNSPEEYAYNQQIQSGVIPREIPGIYRLTRMENAIEIYNHHFYTLTECSKHIFWEGFSQVIETDLKWNSKCLTLIPNDFFRLQSIMNQGFLNLENPYKHYSPALLPPPQTPQCWRTTMEIRKEPRGKYMPINAFDANSPPIFRIDFYNKGYPSEKICKTLFYEKMRFMPFPDEIKEKVCRSIKSIEKHPNAHIFSLSHLAVENIVKDIKIFQRNIRNALSVLGQWHRNKDNSAYPHNLFENMANYLVKDLEYPEYLINRYFHKKGLSNTI